MQILTLIDENKTNTPLIECAVTDYILFFKVTRGTFAVRTHIL